MTCVKWKVIALAVALLACMAWAGVASALPTTDLSNLAPGATVLYGNLPGAGVWYWRDDTHDPTSGSGPYAYKVVKDRQAGYANFTYTLLDDGGGLWFDLGDTYHIHRVVGASRRPSDNARTEGALIRGSVTPVTSGPDVIGEANLSTGWGSSLYWGDVEVDWDGVQWIRISDDDVLTIGDLMVAELRIYSDVPVLDNGYIAGVHATCPDTFTPHFMMYEEALTDNEGMSDFMNPGDPDALHVTGTGGWYADSSNLTPVITFDLGDTYDVGQMLIWNVNWTSANDRGVKEVLIEYSSDGGTNYDPLPDTNGGDLTNGNVTVDMVPVDGEGYTLGDSTYQAAPEMGGVTADHVRISVLSNWGGVVSALSEVRFYDRVVVSEEDIPGDADGDGDVDELDAQALATNWGSGSELDPATWEEGNFDGDYVVGPADAAILAANWHYGVSESGAPVPEPSAVVLLLGLPLALLLWRRK